jgi:ribonuclease HII
MTVRAPASCPDLSAERAFWTAGYRLVAGVDEVGRGAMAGPLVAAAVVLPPEIDGFDDLAARALADVRDSKLLTEDARSRLLPTICKTAIAVAIGMVEADELDEIGVGPANRLAMQRAVQSLAVVPDALVLDATTLDLALPQVGLIDGDARCLSIAAASIVAKVTRDRFMTECHEVDPRFGFAAHKGYCTEDHLAALARYGPCHLHRRSFAPVERVCNEIDP